MDKEIIIDGVNVSGCNNIDEWKHCNICQVLIKTIPNRHQCLTEGDLRCEFYPDCYYKQLQRLKEKLRTEKIYSSQIEELEESLQHAKAENERLKEENYQLQKDCQICENFIDFIPCKPIRDMDYDLQKVISQRDNYSYVLQEIRDKILSPEIIDEETKKLHTSEELDNIVRWHREDKLSKIKAKINEVIGVE